MQPQRASVKLALNIGVYYRVHRVYNRQLNLSTQKWGPRWDLGNAITAAQKITTHSIPEKIALVAWSMTMVVNNHWQSPPRGLSFQIIGNNRNNPYWFVVRTPLNCSCWRITKGSGNWNLCRRLQWQTPFTHVGTQCHQFAWGHQLFKLHRLSSARPLLSRFFISFHFVYLFCGIPSHNDKYNLIFILYLHEPRICNNIGKLFSLR